MVCAGDILWCHWLSYFRQNLGLLTGEYNYVLKSMSCAVWLCVVLLLMKFTLFSWQRRKQLPPNRQRTSPKYKASHTIHIHGCHNLKSNEMVLPNINAYFNSFDMVGSLYVLTKLSDTFIVQWEDIKLRNVRRRCCLRVERIIAIL
jgi:hypothetical protein